MFWTPRKSLLPLPSLWLPRQFASPGGYPCCCAKCVWCSGKTPSSFSVTFSGIANGINCNSCDDLNDTYILSRGPVYVPNDCEYHYAHSYTCSGNCTGAEAINYILLDIRARDVTSVGVAVVVHVNKHYASDSFAFLKHYPSNPRSLDCELDGVSIPFWFGGSYCCDGSSATCHVTAL